MSHTDERTVAVAVQLTNEEALALSQFVKRAGFSEARQKAISDEEAYLMRDGFDRLAEALGRAGFTPR